MEQKQTVYISQPESHQIIRLKRIPNLPRSRPPGAAAGGGDSDEDEYEDENEDEEQDSITDPESNWEPFIGSGERCLPGDQDHCGDGGLASKARLAYPKGNVVVRKCKVHFKGRPFAISERHGTNSLYIKQIWSKLLAEFQKA